MSSGPAPTVVPLAVSARGLTKVYADGERRVEALRGVDLEVPEGSFMAIMGPSGSGKSTLMHLVGALDTPTSGELVIGGASVATMSEKALTGLRSQRIGFVFQFFNLLPTLTAAENVLMPALIGGERPSGVRERVMELLDLVGLADRAGHLPGELSGGEQQRVSLARALMRNPALLLADEPTGNLDTRSGTLVLDLLRRVADDGQTVLMVTHDPRAASRADTIVFMRDGLRAGTIEGGDAEAAASFLTEAEAEAEDARAY